MNTPRQRKQNGSALAGLLAVFVGLCALGGPVRARALDGVRTISVDEIKPGMKGYGLTVFRGEQPERFEVEVIDILHQFQPDLDLILIRTPHPILERAKSVAGMSGSPVYFDGRLAGAYAYGWTYGTEPIAGVTPIANMLREMERPRLAEPRYPADERPPASQRGPRLIEPRSAEPRPAPNVGATPASGMQTATPQLRQAATPLLLGGIPAQLTPWLEDELAKYGLVPLEAGGAQRQAANGAKSASATGTRRSPATLVPGGALSVDLARGDISMRAIGTITHCAGSRVLAFGHPMFNLGQVRLPMSSARVLHVMSSLRSSFKFAESVTPVGAVIQDRASTIVGVTDETAPMIPLQIHLRGVAGIVKPTWNVQIAWHPQITPLLLYTALGSALTASFADQHEFRIQTRTSATISGMGEVTFRDVTQTQSGALDTANLAALRVFALHDIVTRNPFHPARVEALRIDIDVTPGNHALEIEDARVPWSEVDPGSRVPVTVALRPYGGALQQRTVEVTIPTWAAGKDLEVRIMPGNLVPLPRPDPTSLKGAVQNLVAGYGSSDLVISVQTPGRGVLLPGQVLDDVPPSIADALHGANQSDVAKPFVSTEHQAISLPNVIYGRATVQVKVRRHAKRPTKHD